MSTLTTLAERYAPEQHERYFDGEALDVRKMMTRADDDSMTFEGIACPWDVEDSYGTTFRKGCFSAVDSLDGMIFPLLDMHRSADVLGTFTAWEADAGLMIRGEYDDTQAGRDAWTQARSGSKPHLSVGFVWMRTLQQQDEDDWSNIEAARLIETSQITRGMQAVPGAGMTAVRAAMGDKVEPTNQQRIAENVPADDAGRRAMILAKARAWAV